MSRDHEAVRDSQSANAIRAYCVTLAQEIGLTLESSPYWTSTTLPAMGRKPYSLVLSVTEPFKALVPFSYTREEVLAYITGETKVAIQSQIRKELEIRRHEVS